jgi:hypothetical protein
MKTCYLLLLLIITTPCRGQAIHLQGSISDAITNEPIAAVTISILTKKLSFASNAAGRFDLTSAKINRPDSVKFSCIGYQTKTLKIGDIQINGMIKLSPIVNILQEVTVAPNGPVVVKVGCKKEKEDFAWTPVAGQDLAIFIAGSKGVKGTIQTISFYLSNGRGMFKNGDVTAPFRIRLFGVDTDGKPGEELTKAMIITRAKKSRKWFEADVSAYDIQNPDSGFYAAFCLLPYEYYQITYSRCSYDESGLTNEAIDACDIHGPRLGVIEHKTRETRSYLSVARSLENWEWHWINDYYNWEYMIRATIAPK